MKTWTTRVTILLSLGIANLPSACSAGLISLIDVTNDVTLFSVMFDGSVNINGTDQPDSPFIVTYSESKDRFSLSLRTNAKFDFDDDDAQNFDLRVGSLWSINTTIHFADVGGVFGDNPDELRIDLDAQHTAGADIPHDGDGKDGEPFTFHSGLINSKEIQKDPFAIPIPPEVETHKHLPVPDHSDFYHAGKITVGANLETDAIQSFGLELKGNHRGVAVPEPASLVTLSVGLLGLSFLRRRGRPGAVG